MKVLAFIPDITLEVEVYPTDDGDFRSFDDTYRNLVDKAVLLGESNNRKISNVRLYLFQGKVIQVIMKRKKTK